MTIVDDSLSLSSLKFQKYSLNSIHYMLIFNRHGICSFSVNLTNLYTLDENLISAFCSAIISFSEELVGNRVKTIEMGELKLSLIQNGKFFTGLLHESIQGKSFIENKINQVNQFLQEYLKINEFNDRAQYIHDNSFREGIKEIFSQKRDNYFTTNQEIKIIKYLKQSLKLDELEGIILFSDSGKLLFSTVGKSELTNFFKEIDFRVKIFNNSILKLFYTSHNNIIFSDYLEDSLVLILIFNLNIQFGLADYYLKKIVNKIKLILKTEY
jgi:hypothetical protein